MIHRSDRESSQPRDRLASGIACYRRETQPQQSASLSWVKRVAQAIVERIFIPDSQTSPIILPPIRDGRPKVQARLGLYVCLTRFAFDCYHPRA